VVKIPFLYKKEGDILITDKKYTSEVLSKVEHIIMICYDNHNTVISS